MHGETCITELNICGNQALKSHAQGWFGRACPWEVGMISPPWIIGRTVRVIWELTSVVEEIDLLNRSYAWLCNLTRSAHLKCTSSTTHDWIWLFRELQHIKLFGNWVDLGCKSGESISFINPGHLDCLVPFRYPLIPVVDIFLINACVASGCLLHNNPLVLASNICFVAILSPL